MIHRLFQGVLQQSQNDRRAKRYRDLIRKEAAIGGELFGPIPSNGRREFFCLDENTWVWHEEWVDASGKLNVITTRYDLRTHGAFKAQDGHPYRLLSKEEARNLYQAIKMYEKRVKLEVYGLTN